MKLFRSLFFGCAAMLAAVLCMSAPASAVDYSPGVFQIPSVSYDYVVPDVFKAVAALPAAVALPGRSRNSHAVSYVCQNQPNSAFRQSVEAYSHIDPHIRAA
ncbi:hypothetical protein [Brucella sp. NBRC 113783]|uniref:hypothetical protein n=1 Tax=Brucella sp. NBRC 113783 TaxID=3075478 RepID=UPI0029BFFC04|nr:hypothetical protein [Brucella sp. NBRC 113783]MDX4072527.1 hypothetical protein [Brucella sp. NBRC 113783]